MVTFSVVRRAELETGKGEGYWVPRERAPHEGLKDVVKSAYTRPAAKAPPAEVVGLSIAPPHCDLPQTVEVHFDDAVELVVVDPMLGPFRLQADGSAIVMPRHQALMLGQAVPTGTTDFHKKSKHQKEIDIISAARKNRALKAWKGEEFFKPAQDYFAAVNEATKEALDSLSQAHTAKK
eukprot:gnl/TRDRNA2_/TRDRNA2_35407_c0_seq1.p2 gnl/TRDRNA2_/TRDRNA2_35407_c0~~gnl/TRDRNA2_/TRDRNA2_35407_c0_seq1.p2  ORF type:complete len:179 (-),score=40.38 gnl/TRDRNA2_/TRDRNA2_35407_c0_seq1:134-670(-)